MERTYINEVQKEIGSTVKVQGFIENLRNSKYMAFIVLKDVAHPDDLETRLKEHVKATVGMWKYPRWIEVVETPWVTTDWMFFTPVMPDIASSTGRVIWVSISPGAAPLWVTVTATTGNWMFGNCLTASPE